jgi:hypothetical protein
MMLDGEFRYTLSVLGSDLDVYAICVSTEQHDDGILSPKQTHHTAYLNNYALSILRITDSLNYDMYNYGDENLLMACQFGDRPYPQELPLTIFRGKKSKYIDYESILNISSQASGFIPQLVLISDSVIPGAPVSYKYLSLYKIFEMEFFSHGKWKSQFADFCANYESEFASLNLGKQRLANFLHKTRAGCAHIRTGSSQSLGVVGLSNADNHDVVTALPLVRKMAFELLNKKAGGVLIYHPALQGANRVPTSPASAPPSMKVPLPRPDR